MSTSLAQIVFDAKIKRLALIGLAKNVGKTTTTNHLLETLIGEKYYGSNELALTSLGLDGEATDALTGLPKPRYVPQEGLLIATTAELLLRAESEGTQVQRLHELPGRTALGPVIIARVIHPGQVIIAGPTLLRDLASAINRLVRLGANLSIVDGAINRISAAAPAIADACIVCTGASAAATPELVARRTVDIIRRLSIQRTSFIDSNAKLTLQSRLCMFSGEGNEVTITRFEGKNIPQHEAEWIVKCMLTSQHPIFILHGALTEELSRALLAELHKAHSLSQEAELIVEDATKVFCHSTVLQHLDNRGLNIRVLYPIRILALTTNPYTPDYLCSPQHLLDTLAKELPDYCPPTIDVISGYSYS